MADETGVLPWWGERWHKPFFVLFLSSWGIAMASPYLGPDRVSVWTTFLTIVALLSTLATLGRQLPFQNVVLISLMVSSATALWISLIESWFDWRDAILWAAIILSGRGSGQFLMRRWREARFYGWAIFAISAAISAVFGDILYSDWARRLAAPAATLIILLISFPFFMNKRPAEPPVGPQPLIVSIALLVWLLIHQDV